MSILIGSSALKHNGLDFRGGKESDWDMMTSSLEEHYRSRDFDYIPAPQEAIDILKDRASHDGVVARPDDVMTIKLSHMGWDHQKRPETWHKHKNDVLILMSKGFKVNMPLYDILRDFWRSKWGNKDFLSLDQNKEDFFTDNVSYKIDHDQMHLICNPEPTYRKCLADGAQIKIDRDKFEAMPFKDQVSMFQEEIHVIMFERYIYKVKKPLTVNAAYRHALHKTVTQLTKNWATDFILLNLDKFFRPNPFLVSRLSEGLL